MADPRRYNIDSMLHKNGDRFEAKLCVDPSEYGLWIKWHDFEDYKAARRRNSSEDLVTQLGIEVAELRSDIIDDRLALHHERCRREQAEASLARAQSEIESFRRPPNETVTVPSTMWRNALIEIDNLKADIARLKGAAK